MDNNHNLPLWYAVSHNRPGAVKALLRANSRTDPARDTENIAEGGIPLRTALVKVWFIYTGDRELYRVYNRLKIETIDIHYKPYFCSQ